jgi:hypothetical protein
VNPQIAQTQIRLGPSEDAAAEIGVAQHSADGMTRTILLSGLRLVRACL